VKDLRIGPHNTRFLLERWANPGAVITARAFDKATVEHHRLVLVRAQQGGEISFRLATGLFRVPGTHACDREEKVLRPRQVFFRVAGVVGHGINQHHRLCLIEHFFQLDRCQQLVATSLGITGQCYGLRFPGSFDLEPGLGNDRVWQQETTQQGGDKLSDLHVIRLHIGLDERRSALRHKRRHTGSWHRLRVHAKVRGGSG
jgi:hypothetical protein